MFLSSFQEHTVIVSMKCTHEPHDKARFLNRILKSQAICHRNHINISLRWNKLHKFSEMYGEGVVFTALDGFHRGWGLGYWVVGRRGSGVGGGRRLELDGVGWSWRFELSCLYHTHSITPQGGYYSNSCFQLYNKPNIHLCQCVITH